MFSNTVPTLSHTHLMRFTLIGLIHRGLYKWGQSGRNASAGHGLGFGLCRKSPGAEGGAPGGTCSGLGLFFVSTVLIYGCHKPAQISLKAASYHLTGWRTNGGGSARWLSPCCWRHRRWAGRGDAGSPGTPAALWSNSTEIKCWSRPCRPAAS